MLIVLNKNNQELNLDYSNVEQTENFFESERFTYFFDVNIVEKSKELEKLKAFNTLISFDEINELMRGNFLIIIIDNQKHNCTVYRDKSGIKTGYFFVDDHQIVIGTNVHDVAKKSKVKSFNKNAICKYLYGDFLFNGETYYDEIIEFKRGGAYSFNKQLELENVKYSTIDLSALENRLSEQRNIIELRKEIDNAHKGYLCSKNTVLLSGGIDSVAMLIALDDLLAKDQIRAITYKVKDTEEDETYYAKSIANHLEIPIKIIEIDSEDSSNYANFEDRILKMNNPYIGMWIFGNFTGTPQEMFYAGQDTRLHTPSVNPIDRIAFNLVTVNNNLFVKLLDKLAVFFRGIIMLFNYNQNKYLRELYKLSYVFNVKEYVNKYYFKLDYKKFKTLGFPDAIYEELKSYFKIDYTQIKTPRALYNKIVELKWSEQYITDIRYLQDVAKINNTYVAMPFYLESIATFSAAIPFKLSIKNMVGRGRFSNKRRIVKKYILRQALKDKMNDTVYYRAKAVSSTMHLMFNGVLGELIKQELNNDLNRRDSFINKFKLNSFIDRFLINDEWIVTDEDYLLKIYQIGTLAICNRKVLAE